MQKFLKLETADGERIIPVSDIRRIEPTGTGEFPDAKITTFTGDTIIAAGGKAYQKVVANLDAAGYSMIGTV